LSGVSADLVRGWVEAVARPEVVAGLAAVYARATEEITRRAPVCWASGRCCNFRETGHLLYVTGLEAAYTLVRCGSPGRSGLEAATAGGGCPFQVMNLCGVHADKPLGCRLYFCDKSSFPWQNEVYERLLSDLRLLHTAQGIEYRYGEWRALLGLVMEHVELPAWTGADVGTHHQDDQGAGDGNARARLTVEGK